MVKRSSYGVIAIFLMMTLSSCTALNRLFMRQQDPHPPTPLQDIASPSQAHLIWRTQIGRGADDRVLHLQPIVTDRYVYVAAATGQIAALDRQNGQIVWSQDTECHLSSGPAIQGDWLLVGTTDGAILAFSALDGQARWQKELTSELLSTPQFTEDRVIIHTSDDTVYALQLKDGTVLWQYSYPLPSLTLRGSSSPVIADQAVIVGLAGGRLVSLSIADGLPYWEVMISIPSGRSELDRIADIDADPVLLDDVIYAASYNGDLAAVDVITGAILWRRQLSVHAGLIATTTALYIIDATDVIWAATPTDGTGYWKQDALRYRRLSAPRLMENKLLVGDKEGWLHWITTTDGQLSGRIRITKAPIIGSAIVTSDHHIIVQASDGTVATLRYPTSQPAPATK
jgi:outer membrane protein assembly factor BamB